MGKPRPAVLLPLPVSWAIAVLFLGILAGPFLAAAAAAAGEGGGGGLEEVLGSGRIRGLLLRSVLLAAMAATLASAAGAAVGVSLGLMGPRCRRLALGLLAVPFSLSPVIAATGFLWVLGPAGWIGVHLPWTITADLGGPALVLGLAGAPVPAILVFLARRRRGAELVEAALLSPGSLRGALAIGLPPVLPHLAAGWLLVFLMALFSSAVPSLCRQSVLAEEILVRYGLHFDPATAGFLGLLLAAAGLVVLALFRFLAPPSALAGAGEADRARPAGPLRRRLAALVIGIFLAASAGIPLSGHLSRLPPLGEWPRIAGDLLPSLGFSLGLGAAGAAIALLLGALWSMEVLRGRVFRGAPGELLGLLPLFLPGPLLAVGLIRLLGRWPLRELLDSSWALAIAKGIAGCPYAFVILLAASRSIPEAEIEALALTRRSPWGLVARRIAGPAALAAWLAFILGIGETDLALLLAPPGTRPLPVKIYTIYHFGAPGDAAVLALALSALTIALALAAAAMGRKIGTFYFFALLSFPWSKIWRRKSRMSLFSSKDRA